MNKVMRWGTCMLLLFVAVALGPAFGQQAFAAETTINASDIKGFALTLEDDTVLNLDTDLKLSSIASEDCKLTIEGEGSLSVSNKDGKAIGVASLKISDGLEIAEPEGGKVKGGTVIDESGEPASSLLIKAKAEAKDAGDDDVDSNAKAKEPTRAGDAADGEPTNDGNGDGSGDDAPAADECDHELTETAAKDASCTEDGNIQYWYCSKCGGYFKDEAASEQIDEADTVIEAKGHTLSHYTKTAATCTEAGNIEYWHCTECGKYFKDENATTEIKQADTVAAVLGHNLKHVKAKAATCTKDGHKEYWTCKRCGGLFSDAAGKKPIKESATTVSKTGHDWGAWEVVKEASTTEKGLKRRVCKNNSKHVQEKAIARVIAYSFEKGANSTWTKGAKSGLDMVVKRNVKDDKTYDLFKGVSVDDKVIDPTNYTAAKGGTKKGGLKLSFKQAYLEKLAVGNHKVKVTFEDGDAETTLTVKAAASKASSGTSGKTANTGDRIPVAVIAGILLAAAAALAGIVVARRRMS